MIGSQACMIQTRNIGGGRWRGQLVRGLIIVGAIEEQADMQRLGAGQHRRGVASLPGGRLGAYVGLEIALVLYPPIASYLCRSPRQKPTLEHMRWFVDGLGHRTIQREGHVFGSFIFS
ncbi:hypothetical protein, partial [Pseudomonas aeruginosa]|uniref:hypothetical protein n=1 Tax=Pseudomonas aeruginosa TaxID=287 RepID=UPI0032635D57